MKKVMSVVLVLILTVGIISGCSFNPNVKVNTVFVEKDGTIQSVSIETFEKEYYDDKDLKGYAQQQIDDYKKNHATGTVKLEKLTVKNKQAKLIMKFNDYKTYAAFNKITFFAGTIEQAKALYDFDLNFYEAAQAKEAIDPATEQVLETEQESTQSEHVFEETTEQTSDVEYEMEDDTAPVQESANDNRYKESEDIKDAEQMGETEALDPSSQSETESMQSSTQETQQGNVKTGLQTVDLDKVLSDDSYKVVILQENTDIEIKGKILYVSSHVKVTGNNTATVTGEGEDNTNVTPAYIIYQ